jgi:hypothetical protein
MKRAFILMLLMLMASSAWGAVSVYPDDGEGNFKTYGLPGGGGGAALSNISDWTLASGLITNDSTINMHGLVNSDSFSNSSLDPMWNTSTAGSGTIVETTSLVLTTPVSADGALLCYDHDLTRTNNYRVRATVNLTLGHYYGMIVDKATQPTVDAIVTFAANLRSFDYDSGGWASVTYDSGHTINYWNQTDNNLWVVAAGDAHAGLDLTNTFIFEIENDGTNIFKRVYDSTGEIQYLYTYRAWSAMESETNAIWFCLGDAYNNQLAGALTVTNFEHYGDFLTTSPVATMGQITVGAEIKRLGLIVSCESGATITWRYDIGAGWVTPSSGTLSDLESALIGTSPSTLNLEAAFNSNGTANCDLYSDGASITTE